MASSLIHNITGHILFQGFSSEEVELVLETCETRQLEPGETLINRGQTNNKLYLLAEGKLEVIIEKDGSKVAVPIQPGECLGEMSLVMGVPTTAMARACEHSTVLVISEETFWDKMVTSRRGVRNLMSLMATRLRRSNHALIKEIEEQLKYQHLEKDLKTAGKIQANIVPDGARLFPNRPEIEVYARMHQARKVGGDFYDAFALDNDHIYFAIGDASGKGMPAALFMMRAFTSLRLLVGNNQGLQGVLPAVNDILYRNNNDMMFVSLFAGVLNLRTGLFSYVNAGHNPPFATLGGTAYQLMELPRDTFLGIREKEFFSVAEMKVTPGDSLVLYTDGVPEATDPDQVAFGTGRMQQTLAKACGHPMKTVVCQLENAVEDFVNGAPQHDDFTILAFRYLGWKD